MRGREHRWLVGLLCGLVLPLVSARAQSTTPEPPGPSYVEIQPPGNNPNVADFLRERLDRLQGVSETQELLKKLLGDARGGDLMARARQLGVTPEMMERWRQQYGGRGLGNGYLDPQLKAKLQEALKSQGFSPQQQQRIENTLKSLPANPPELGPGPPFTTPPRTMPKGPDKQSPVEPPSDNSGDTKLPQDPSPQEPNPSAPAPQEPAVDQGSMSQGLANWLLEQARHMQEMGSELHDSPALQDAIQHLDRYLSGQRGWQPGGGLGRLTDRLGRLIERARTKPLWSGSSLPHLPRIEMPSLPRPSLPSAHLPRVHLPGLHTPHVRIGAPGAGGGKVLLWLAVIVVGALLAWRLSRVTRPTDWFRARDRVRLGPWPVDPASVRTREQLVQAFEYLSVLRLGSAARSWNHLQIAASLGGEAIPSREAADQLAALYEQARYVPGPAPLSHDAVKTARRTLVLLAGVAQA